MRKRFELIMITMLIIGISIMIIAGYVPRQQLTNALKVTGIMASVIIGTVTAFSVRHWHHKRHVIMPLHWALSRVLHIDPKSAPKYIHVSRARDSHEIAAVYLPRDFVDTEQIKLTVQNILKAKLRVRDVDFSWTLSGRKPFVQMTRAPKPPDKALAGDPAIQKMIMNAKESAPLLGIGPRVKPVAIDLDADSPHILVSAGTGGGKSTIMRTIACQFAHNNALVIILDIKRTSHKWAVDLPGVEIYRDIADIHRQLLWLRDERERRSAKEEQAGMNDFDPGIRILIMVEEGNTMISELKEYWNQIKQRGDSPMSPAIVALRQILLMGRSAKMHVLGVFQLATAADMGGPVIREQFFNRILSRYSSKAWNMLANGARHVPSSRHPGRVQVILGDAVYETQVILFSEQQARDWARARVPVISDGTVRSDVSHVGQPEPVPVPTVITLPGAIDLGITSLKYEALRKASQRDGFPASVGMAGRAKLYPTDQLIEWERNRNA